MNIIQKNNSKKNKLRLMSLGFLTLSLMVISNTSFAAKDCYTCKSDYIPGSPVEGNQTLGQLSQVSLALLSDADGSFMSNLYGYCMAFPGDVKGAKTLRKRVISEMEKNLVNGKIDSYFLEAGCNPSKIGSTRSPIAHLAAELPTVRTEHLEVVRKYFVEIKKDDLFTKMINAKNTQGHTTLDYVQYLQDNGEYIDSQLQGLGAFIKYLCSHGGKYSTYKNKSCEETQVATK